MTSILVINIKSTSVKMKAVQLSEENLRADLLYSGAGTDSLD